MQSSAGHLARFLAKISNFHAEIVHFQGEITRFLYLLHHLHRPHPCQTRVRSYSAWTQLLQAVNRAVLTSHCAFCPSISTVPAHSEPLSEGCSRHWLDFSSFINHAWPVKRPLNRPKRPYPIVTRKMMNTDPQHAPQMPQHKPPAADHPEYALLTHHHSKDRQYAAVHVEMRVSGPEQAE